MRKIRSILMLFLLLIGTAVGWAQTYSNEKVIVKFAMNDTSNPGAYTATLDGVFRTVSFDLGTAKVTGTEAITDKENKTVCAAGLKINPASASTDQISWNVTPAVGLTFTPTKVSGYINRSGTDSEKGVVISAKAGNNDAVTLGTYTALRSGKGINKTYDNDGVAQYEIELTADQQSSFATTGKFSLISTIGVGNTKNGDFGEVVIEGTVSGTVADVKKFTINVASNISEAGTSTIYPVSSNYVEGDEITLTAVENFGYDFVNWTNAAGTEVSAETSFKATVSANETYTANYKKVNTYALNVTVEGGAKDYMISYNPAATVVDNKNMYEEGTKVTLTAAKNDILTFGSWSTGETESTLAVTMNADVDITAKYSAVDYIVAWDFYKTGNQGRIADFASENNDADALVLRDASGTQYSWLDKSSVKGGYEGRPGACNWVNTQPIGTTYWQTCFDASNFTDIVVKSAMVYNYNAYETYNVEYSLDGENWSKLGSITIAGAKNWTDSELSMPEAANNQSKVYVRWIADTTSEIKGASSSNDGAGLGAIYILGTEKMVDDGSAPEVESTVPANGATGASANGKIVVNFSKKVELTASAKATLTGNGTIVSLTPVVSGKTITCEYKGLDYSTSYTFTLAANSVSDLATGSHVAADAVSINFTTKVRPEISKAEFDGTVSNGEELAAAISKANARTDQTKVFRIFLKDGIYVLPNQTTDKTVSVTLADGSSKSYTYKVVTTPITGSNIAFIGSDYNKVVITNKADEVGTYVGKYGEACIAEGIGNGDVLMNKGTNNYFQGITIKTSMGDARGRDIAFNDQGDKTVFKDCCLWGYQDTYVSNNQNGRFYFENGVIRGRTDYMCGKGDVFYNGVTLQQCGQGGYIAVPSNPRLYGYIYRDCYIKQETEDVTFTLGRPWGQGTPIALFINTKMDVAPLGNGWSEMSGGYPKQMAEYNSMLTSGTVLDLSGRKTVFGSTHTNNPILTAEEAAALTVSKVMGGTDDWNPTNLTEQASAPTNVKRVGNTLSWDNNNYVIGWAIFADDTMLGFTTVPTFEIPTTPSAKGAKTTSTEPLYTVRAMNEMGGLSEPADEFNSTTAVSAVKTAQAKTNGKYIENGKIVILVNGVKYSVTGVRMK